MKRRLLMHVNTRHVVMSLTGALFAVAFWVSLVALTTPAHLTMLLRGSAPHHIQVAWVLPGSNLWASGIRPGKTLSPSTAESRHWITRASGRAGGF